MNGSPTSLWASDPRPDNQACWSAYGALSGSVGAIAGRMATGTVANALNTSTATAVAARPQMDSNPTGGKTLRRDQAGDVNRQAPKKTNSDTVRNFKAIFDRHLTEAETIQNLLEGKPALLYHELRGAGDYDIIKQSGWQSDRFKPMKVDNKDYTRAYASSVAPVEVTDAQVVVKVSGKFFDCRSGCNYADWPNMISKGYAGIVLKTGPGINNSDIEVVIFDGKTIFRGENIIRLNELVPPAP